MIHPECFFCENDCDLCGLYFKSVLYDYDFEINPDRDATLMDSQDLKGEDDEKFTL